MASLQQKATQQLMKQGLIPNKDKPATEPAHKKSSAERIVSALRLSQHGHTQQYIADQLGITQSAVSLILAKYQRNTTKDARQILEAKAADMALNVAKHGRPADQLRALEGLSVIDLREKQQPGLSITINGFALVGLGLSRTDASEGQQPILDVQGLSPSLSDGQGQPSVDSTEAKGNIKPLISPTNSSPSEGNCGAGIDGGPTPAGGG